MLGSTRWPKRAGFHFKPILPPAHSVIHCVLDSDMESAPSSLTPDGTYRSFPSSVSTPSVTNKITSNLPCYFFRALGARDANSSLRRDISPKDVEDFAQTPRGKTLIRRILEIIPPAPTSQKVAEVGEETWAKILNIPELIAYLTVTKRPDTFQSRLRQVFAELAAYLASAYNAPFKSNARDALVEHLHTLDNRFTDSDQSLYARAFSIINSSGTGKSRTVQQLGIGSAGEPIAADAPPSAEEPIFLIAAAKQSAESWEDTWNADGDNNILSISSQCYERYIAPPLNNLMEYLQNIRGQRVQAIVYFDETGTLQLLYRILLRLSNRQPRTVPLWLVFMATNVSVTDYMPTPERINSARLSPEGATLIPPWYSLGWDHWAEKAIESRTMKDLRSWKHASYYGRPMWYAHILADELHDLLQ
ncbi:hypothetical protein DACRYDRAFT_119634, partial [Dacryopinax primogenitus]